MSDAPVVVVGAGPAGMRAAAILAEADIRPIVIDSGGSAGGRFWRKLRPGLPELTHGSTLHDAEQAARARSAYERLAGRIDHYPGTTAVDATRELVWALGPTGEVDCTPWGRLLVCTGAMDRIVPIPGWTLPGVYTIGGAQTALEEQGVAIGGRILLVGTGPLLYLTAAGHARAGVEVAAVLDTARTTHQLAAIADLLADRTRLALGLRCLSILRRAGVPVLRGVRGVRILGSARVEGVEAEHGGRSRSFRCDAVALGFGLVPQVQLLDLLGVPMRLDAASGLWLPEVDPTGRTPVAGVYAAGDGARILGGQAAALAGELAALAVLEDLGRVVDPTRSAHLRRELDRHGRFARGIARAFPFPADLEARIADSTIVCRCEEITAGEIRTVVREHGPEEVNRLKALCRVGMGRCQGRLCGGAAARILAAERAIPLAAAGRFRSQAPIVPLPARAALTERGSPA